MISIKTILSLIIRIILHVVFWAGILFFYTYFFGYQTTDISYVVSFSLFLMPITIAITYVSIYKLIPVYLIKKRYFLFGLYSAYTIIISAYLIFLSVFYGLTYLSKFGSKGMAPISKNPLFIMVGVYLIVIMVSAYKLLRLNLKNGEKTRLLETKILQTQLKLKEQELSYLKMQIHPHFLFNTLNTIYGFALKKGNETPEMILKLSNLLDYLLYQTDKPFVLLNEEISHIQDYIALEKMRFRSGLNVNFTLNGTFEKLKVAPMLLLPFVENSFKHGKRNDGILQVEITISCDPEKLNFSIKNSVNSINAINNGIGLENIQKRLIMLYPNKHELTLKNTSSFFEVNLTLTTI